VTLKLLLLLQRMLLVHASSSICQGEKTRALVIGYWSTCLQQDVADAFMGMAIPM
jgi:hypothetical protein